MGTLTTNYQFQKPTVGGDYEVWADDYTSGDPSVDPSPGLVGNWRKLDLLQRVLEDKIRGLENSLPANTYFEEGANYRIIGTTLECWGSLVTQSVPVHMNYAKRYMEPPAVSLTVSNPNATDRGPCRESQTLPDAKLEIELAARANSGFSDIAGVTIFWYAIGQWDGVS